MSPCNIELIGCYWTLAGPSLFGSDDYSPWPLRDRIEAAARAGYTGIGLKQADIRHSLLRHSYTEIATLLRDNGILHLELEALLGWYATGQERIDSDKDRQLLLEAASELEAMHIKIAGNLCPSGTPAEHMHESFQVLAAQCKAAGVRAALEPIAFTEIPNLDTAIAVMGESAGNSAALMIDSWHVARGALSLSEIAKLPPGYIAGVELCDGLHEVQSSALDDTLNNRLRCGLGQFDLGGLIETVLQAGFVGPFGVELISYEQRALPLEQAARLSFDSTHALLKRYYPEG